ncbi:MAG TPA: hypothetical protein VM389_09595 [Phycisphaerae bacterium]|nr:hypothetical protein [Phycisphaerae bacterium]
MSEKPSDARWISTLAGIWAACAYGLLSAALVVAAVYLALGLGGWGWLLPALAILALPLAAFSVALIRAAVASGARGEQTIREIADRLKRLESLAEPLLQSGRDLVELSRMSDAAKSVLYQRREIEAIEEVLHEYLIAPDYAAAESFANEVEGRLGRAELAQAMRTEIAEARKTSAEQKIEAALARVDACLAEHQWKRAAGMAQSLLRSRPDHPKVKALPEAIRDARNRRKLALLAEYDEAVRGNLIDRSIELLVELDRYLTPTEAAALEESARGVFKAKLHTLGVQFAMRVTEENWPEAIAIGQEIMREYPNSRMAGEVSGKMDRLTALVAARDTAAVTPEPSIDLSVTSAAD